MSTIEHNDAATPVPKVPATPQHVLRRAARALETGEIRWGQGDYHRAETGCRCALGAITYAVAPAAPAGNPRWIPDPMGRVLATLAAGQLADWITQRLDAIAAIDDDGDLDPVETVGEWNDRDGRTVDDVIEALVDAADDLDRQAQR